VHGHAIEARLYAEDPQKGFLPSVGRLEHLRLPAGDGIRVDTGVREGDAVSPFYDPMIAKIIAWDETREGAAAKLASALETAQIAGLQTNNAFLIRTLKHPDFVAGRIDTGFIERHQAAIRRYSPGRGATGRRAIRCARLIRPLECSGRLSPGRRREAEDRGRR
jgi:3-methylcrotonyl-CoA carboxylase alpha subunit